MSDLKKLCAALLVLALLGTGVGLCESTMDELRGMRKSAGERIAELEPVPTPAPEAEPTPAPEVRYDDLENGARGDAVVRLQRQLIALDYLNGKADGVYGSLTASAVRAFQRDAGLPETGDADADTQRALFAVDAGIPASYEALDYAEAAAHPKAYAGRRVRFGGTVLQVLEDDLYADTLGVYTVLRVATRRHSDDVVYVAWFRPADVPSPAEGDEVEVRGVASGRTRYLSTGGDYVSLPRVEADGVGVD